MADQSPTRMRRLMPWILWSTGGLSVLGVVFMVLWLWLPRWAPEWVVKHSPWVDPVLRAMSGQVTRNHQLIELEEPFMARVEAWGSSAHSAYSAGMESPDPRHRMVSVMGCYYEHPSRSPLPDHVREKLITLALRDDHLGVRMHAFYALSSEKSARMSEVRAQGIKDPAAEVRRAVVHGLDPTTSELDWQTLSFALIDSEEDVRSLAVICAHDAGERRAVPRLLEMVNEERTSNHTFHVVNSALSEFKVVEAIPVLKKFLEGEDAYCAPIALKTIAEIDAQEGFQLHLKLLDGPNPAVRAFVASELGEFGDPRAIEPLTVALQDPDLLAMSQVIFALCHLKAISAVEAILERLEARHEDVMKSEIELGNFRAMIFGGTGMRVGLDEMLDEVGTLPLTSEQRERLGRLRKE